VVESSKSHPLQQLGAASHTLVLDKLVDLMMMGKSSEFLLRTPLRGFGR
jgi:hypothetical protein